MSPLRNIALTVHELEDGEFYWVLLEGVEHSSEEVLSYTMLDVASSAQSSYANALVSGMAVMRHRFGNNGPRG